jgi:hypothetical protein
VANTSAEMARCFTRSGVMPQILLEPHCEGGNVDVVDGLAEIVERKTGRFTSHKCPARPVSCKHCGDQILRLSRPPRTQGERMVIVDALPDPTGTIVVGADGYAELDPDRRLSGARHKWHRAHGVAERRYA